MRPTVLEKINPFIKVVTILVCGILMALTSSWKLNLAVLIAALLALLLLSNCKLSSLVKTFVPVILLAGAVFVSGMSYGKSAAQSASIYDVASMDSALLLSTRILAYVGMGMMFALSTDQKEFIMSLMHQAHVKPKFAYGVLAAVNLIPTLRREWDEVNRIAQEKNAPAYCRLARCLIHWSTAFAGQKTLRWQWNPKDLTAMEAARLPSQRGFVQEIFALPCFALDSWRQA